MNIRIHLAKKELHGSVRLPGSKSISNRLLIIDALSGFRSNIQLLSKADDTTILQKALHTTQSTINAHDAGTAYRFLTAYYAILEGKNTTLIGTNRMHNRPIAPLVRALQSLGADIKYLDQDGFPPLHIHGTPLQQQTQLVLDRSQSSQFVSALLLIAPYIRNGLRLDLAGKAVSEPYIHMTIDLMRHFGAKIQHNEKYIIVDPGSYPPSTYEVESDWSAAVFFYTMASLVPSRLQISNLHMHSTQADQQIANFCNDLGVFSLQNGSDISLNSMPRCPRLPYSIDAATCPDLVPALVTALALLGIDTEIKNVAHLRLKESDRILSLQKELSKIGANILTKKDHIYLSGLTKVVPNTIFESHDDHRIAMSLALLAIANPIIIQGAECVSKSFPEYWDQLSQLGFDIQKK